MQRVVQDGLILEVQPDGTGKVVGYADAPAQGRVFSLPPNPKEVRQEARADEDQQLQREAAIRADRAAERADKTANRQAAAAERAANAQNKPTEFQSKSAGFLGRMMQAERDYGHVPDAERSPRGLARQTFHNLAPGLENTFVNSTDRQKADQAAENFIAASLRQESGAAISPQEFTRQYNIFYPQPGDSAEVIAQKAAARAQAIEGFRTAAGPLAEQIANHIPSAPANNHQGTNRDGIVGARGGNDVGGGSGDGAGIAPTDGRQRITHDPRASSMVDAMVNAGAGEATINAALKRQGIGPMLPGQFKAAKDWMAKNPGQKYFGADASKVEDLNLGQRILANPTIAPVAAGVARAGDTASAGILGAMTGEEGRGALDAMGQLHPEAALAGDIAGSLAGSIGGEKLVGTAVKNIPNALRAAPVLGDMLYGGTLGFNRAQDGEGGMGALEGAAAGLGGNLLMKGAGRAVRGVSDPVVQLLRSKGIPLTVGQAVGNGGFVGRIVKGVEDRLTGFPLVGDVVNARRTEGVKGFADRMANDALAPINGSTSGYGEATVNDMLNQGGNAYQAATAGAHVPLDPQFATDMSQVRAFGGTLPDDLSQRFGKAIQNRVAPIEADGQLTGDTFQQAIRGLKSYRAEATKPGFEQDYRNYLGQGIDALKGQMGRGGGQDVVDNLAKADQAWKQIKIFQKATEAAKNGARSGEVGLPMPSQFNDAATAAASKFGGPRFNGDLIDAGQKALPSKVGDSGTAGRYLVGSMLGAAGAGAGGIAGSGEGTGGILGGASAGGLGTLLLLAAGGSKPAQSLMVKALADRPDLAKKAGNLIYNHGWVGSGVLTPMLIGSGQ